MQIRHKNAKLNDKLSFLIICCQAEPSEEDILFITSYLSHITDYQSFITTAMHHGILPLVYKTLKKVLHNSSLLNTQHLTLNSELLNELKVHYKIIAQRNMLMCTELIRIINLLQENNIETLSFKGPTLSQIAYGDITLRQFGDLDILIHPDDFIEVHKLLTEKGYNTKYNYKKSIEKVLELIPDHMFISPKSQIPIEIHNKLFASNFPIIVSDNIFWENSSTTVTINRKNIPTFSHEYLLFYLCLHGSKHLFSRISWIMDIAILIDNSDQDFDWKLFQKIVDDHHLHTMISVSLHLAVILFQVRIPSNILQTINSNKKSLKIARSIIKNITDEPEDLERFTLTHLKMFDSWSEKIKYSIYLFKPSVVDYQIFDMKYKFDTYYFLLRPFRILYRTIKK